MDEAVNPGARVGAAVGLGGAPNSEALKERLYVSIVALSILLAIDEHTDHIEVAGTAAALTIGVVASVLAAVLAEVISHVAVHRTVPSASQLLRLLRGASWALLVLLVPLLLFALAGLDVLTAQTALTASVWAIVASLGLITFLAVHRSGLPLRTQVALLAVTLVFGAIVVELQVAAHG